MPANVPLGDGKAVEVSSVVIGGSKKDTLPRHFVDLRADLVRWVGHGDLYEVYVPSLRRKLLLRRTEFEPELPKG